MPFRHLIRATVGELAAPSQAVLADALEAETVSTEHERLVRDVEAFAMIEQHPATGAAFGAGLRAAAWNAERLKFEAPSARLVEGVAPDVLFLTESDVGMARSGNRHTTADLAEALGMGFVYGIEFLELGLGDDGEQALHASETNRLGFHGNALLTRMPLDEAFLVRLDDGAVWWLDAPRGQRRLGWRMAIGGRIVVAGEPVWLVSVHLESKSDAGDRARQVKRLLDHVDLLAGDAAVLIGGDFNTKALPGGALAATLFDYPSTDEPLFSHMRAAGFEWSAANTAEATQRTRPDGNPKPPFRRLDWLFARGLLASTPLTVAAVDETGDAISDHDLVAAEFRLP